jgi:hypothetical protein
MEWPFGGDMKKTLLIFATAALMTIPAMAQTSTPAPAPAPAATAPAPAAKPTIQQRKRNQQERIAQGVKSGQLTAGETSKLEKQEAGINKEERAMKQQNNGKLTAQDRKTIRQQQNQESRRIYRDKHNNKTQPGVTPDTPKK